MRCYHVRNLLIFCDSLNAFLRSMQSVNCLLKMQNKLKNSLVSSVSVYIECWRGIKATSCKKLQTCSSVYFLKNIENKGKRPNF